MPLPAHLLIHTVEIVNPVEDVDAYGNTIWEYDLSGGVPVAAWMQQDQRAEQFTDGRATDTQGWLLMTNEPDVGEKARVLWTGPNGPMTFELDGPAAPVYAGLAQAFHHTEATLRVVTG